MEITTEITLGPSGQLLIGASFLTRWSALAYGQGQNRDGPKITRDTIQRSEKSHIFLWQKLSSLPSE